MPMSRSASVNSFMKYGNYNDTNSNSDVISSKINLCKTNTPGSTKEANYFKQMSK